VKSFFVCWEIKKFLWANYVEEFTLKEKRDQVKKFFHRKNLYLKLSKSKFSVLKCSEPNNYNKCSIIYLWLLLIVFLKPLNWFQLKYVKKHLLGCPVYCKNWMSLISYKNVCSQSSNVGWDWSLGQK